MTIIYQTAQDALAARDRGEWCGGSILVADLDEAYKLCGQPSPWANGAWNASEGEPYFLSEPVSAASLVGSDEVKRAWLVSTTCAVRGKAREQMQALQDRANRWAAGERW